MQQINMVQTKVVINHLTLNIFFFNKTNKRTYQIYQKQSFIFSFLLPTSKKTDIYILRKKTTKQSPLLQIQLENQTERKKKRSTRVTA